MFLVFDVGPGIDLKPEVYLAYTIPMSYLQPHIVLFR